MSLHHLPYAYEPVRIHRSYTVYGISASCEQSHLNIRWEFLYYTFNVYVLPRSFLFLSLALSLPLFSVLFIYIRWSCDLRLFFFYLYIYDSTYAISVDCAGATLIALLYIYVIRIILKGIYVYVLRLRFSPCENLAQSALAFGLEIVICIHI